MYVPAQKCIQKFKWEIETSASHFDVLDKKGPVPLEHLKKNITYEIHIIL